MDKIQNIKAKNGDLLAIIIKSNYDASKSHFVTPDDALQNVGYFNYNKGHVVKAHYHPKEKRVIYGTPEVVVMKKGKLKLTIFDNQQQHVGDFTVSKDDVFLLISGGHAEEILADTTVFVVKQGPYLGDKDKIHFEGVCR